MGVLMVLFIKSGGFCEGGGFGVADVNADADGELVGGIEDGTELLAVEALDNVQEPVSRNLMPVRAVEFRVVVERDAGRERLLYAQDVPTASHVQKAGFRVEQRSPVAVEADFLHQLRLNPVRRVPEILLRGALEAELPVVQDNLITLPGDMVANNPRAFVAEEKASWPALDDCGLCGCSPPWQQNGP